MSLHADVAVSARDRRRLERLCRYVARPPLAHDRLEVRPDGRLALRLKTRWRDGTTHILMDGTSYSNGWSRSSHRPAPTRSATTACWHPARVPAIASCSDLGPPWQRPRCKVRSPGNTTIRPMCDRGV